MACLSKANTRGLGRELQVRKKGTDAKYRGDAEHTSVLQETIKLLRFTSETFLIIQQRKNFWTCFERTSHIVSVELATQDERC